KIMQVDGGARTYLSDTYRTMISSEPSLRALREFFDVLLEDDGAVLWHCTQGKDRTGVVAAAILLALGVDRDAIMRDYMKTNRSCFFKNFWIFIGVVLVTFSVNKARNLNLLLSSRRDFMRAAFDEIDKVWGGTDGFLRKALQLTDDELFRLREAYLV
ncbi:MAG: tyrosine-protein phosphatase, partial [Clostridia bacterium]|nr:tyrosine-protein phosphatase [Clostridia bacterium]